MKTLFPFWFSNSGVYNTQSVIYKILFLMERSIAIIIGLAVVYFLWGLLKYVKSAAGEDKEEAKGVIVNGILILFVMVSIWGLVNLVAQTIGISSSSNLHGGGSSYINI